MSDSTVDLSLPGRVNAREWRQLGALLSLHWPKGLYFEAGDEEATTISRAGPRLHYLPKAFLVVKDDSSLYAAIHGREYSCVITMKLHLDEGIIAVVDPDSEAEAVAHAVLDQLYQERVGLKP